MLKLQIWNPPSERVFNNSELSRELLSRKWGIQVLCLPFAHRVLNSSPGYGYWKQSGILISSGRSYFDLFTGIKDSLQGKARKSRVGFSESVLAEMQDSGLCSSPAPRTRQTCSMDVRNKSIKICMCSHWKSVVPLAHLNSQPLGESLLIPSP